MTISDGVIANPNVRRILAVEADLPAWLGRCNPKNNINSLIDISGAGATFSLSPNSGTISYFTPDGIFTSKNRGFTSDILATDNVSIYSVHKQQDLTYSKMNAIPFNDGSQATTGTGFGTCLTEISPRNSDIVMYANGFVYYDAADGTKRATLNNTEEAANVTPGDWVFRLESLDALNYQMIIYTGYKGILYKTLTQSAWDLSLRNKTQPIRFGYAPNSPAVPDATSSLITAEVGVLAGAVTDAMAAKLYTEARALQALSGISV
ncbi:hypothetical protein ACL2XG_05255 [Sodalis sp. RH24]